MNTYSAHKRIVSLCPSVTQTIIDLDKEKVLNGITDYCPSTGSRNKNCQYIGGPKKVNIKKIKEIQPDLIIFVKEENSYEDFKILNTKFNCVVFDIKSISASIELLATLGKLLNAERISGELTGMINSEISQINLQAGTYYYFVWNNPAIAAGTETYIHSFLALFGFNNKININGYPKIRNSDYEKSVDYIFLPDEPYHFKPENSSEIISKFPESKIIYLDGRTCSWFGSYTLNGIRELKQKLHELKNR